MGSSPLHRGGILPLSEPRRQSQNSNRLPDSGLFGDGTYSKDVDRLKEKFPLLRFRDFNLYNSLEDKALRRTRAAKFRFRNDSTVERMDFPTLETLRQSFSTVETLSSSSEPCRELYMVEGLDPQYVSVLGDALQVDPNVFMRHERTVLWQYLHESAIVPQLPSLIDSNKSFTLDYCELVHFLQPFEHYAVRTAENERLVDATRIDNNWNKVGVVQRRASFCARHLKSKGWQGMYKTHPWSTVTVN